MTTSIKFSLLYTIVLFDPNFFQNSANDFLNFAVVVVDLNSSNSSASEINSESFIASSFIDELPADSRIKFTRSLTDSFWFSWNDSSQSWTSVVVDACWTAANK